MTRLLAVAGALLLVGLAHAVLETVLPTRSRRPRMRRRARRGTTALEYLRYR